MTIGDRVAVLKDGYLQQVDTPQNIYDRPGNVFVGAFIGSPSMNLYEGQIEISGDGGSVTFGSHMFGLDEHVFATRSGRKGYDGKPVIVGIRPEDFEDAAMVEHVSENRRHASRVSLIESLGSEVMAHFRLDAKTVDSGDPDVVEESTSGSVANAVGRFSPRTHGRIGENIDIAVAIEIVDFFDAGTRKAIWS